MKILALTSRLRFALGILRHPGQARYRLRELTRILIAPPSDRAVPVDNPVDVDVIPVAGPDALGEKLVSIYVQNPSPFVTGPTSLNELINRIDNGFRHFLVLNSNGDAVGARAFNTNINMLCNTVTAFAFRGRGYQLYAGKLLRKQLEEEGCREFCCAVLKKNTRILRSMETEGWVIRNDPNNPTILLGRLLVNSES